MRLIEIFQQWNAWMIRRRVYFAYAHGLFRLKMHGVSEIICRLQAFSHVVTSRSFFLSLIVYEASISVYFDSQKCWVFLLQNIIQSPASIVYKAADSE